MKSPALLVIAMIALQDEIMEHPASSVGMLVEGADKYRHIICGSEFTVMEPGDKIIGYCHPNGDWVFDNMDSDFHPMRELLAEVVALGNGVWSHPRFTADLAITLPDGAIPWNHRFSDETVVVETHDGYWDCECRTHYIYQKCIDHCAQCGCNSDAMPDARRVEMENPKNWASPLAYQQWRAENFHDMSDKRIAEADEDERLLGFDQYSTTGSMEGK